MSERNEAAPLAIQTPARVAQRVAAAWLVIGAVFSTVRITSRLIGGLPILPWKALYAQWVWLVWAILAGWLAHYTWRTAASRFRVPRLIAAFVVLFAIFETVNVPVRLALGWLLVPMPIPRRVALMLSVGTDNVGLVGFAIVSMATIAAVLFQSWYQRGAAAEIEAAEIATRVSQAKLNRLRGEVRPDLLCQWVSQIDSLMERQPDRAEAALLTLADYLRLTLVRIRNERWPVAAEIDYVRHYASLIEQGEGRRRIAIASHATPAGTCSAGSLLSIIEHLAPAGHDRNAVVRVDREQIAIDLTPPPSASDRHSAVAELNADCAFPAAVTEGGIVLKVC